MNQNYNVNNILYNFFAHPNIKKYINKMNKLYIKQSIMPYIEKIGLDILLYIHILVNGLSVNPGQHIPDGDANCPLIVQYESDFCSITIGVGC
jgi:hypothetical protein